MSRGFWHIVACITLMGAGIVHAISNFVLAETTGWRYAIGIGLFFAGIAVAVAVMSLVYGVQAHRFRREVQNMHSDTMDEAMKQVPHMVRMILVDLQRQGMISPDVRFEDIDVSKPPSDKLN